MPRNSSQKGFTLIETLIYSLLISFIIGTSLVAVYQILSSSNSLSAKTVTEQEAAFIAAKIKWALNDISAINSPAVNSSSSSLSVNKNGYPPPLILTLSGNDFTITKSGVPLIVNSSRVIVSGLSFELERTTVGAVNTDVVTALFYVDGKKYEIKRFLR
ncbi:MAG: hypothetical protein A3B99_05095 [Candidatus Yanofskybacteria bacterium RIFCSPHIGHO2_02_FULL_44_12b]|uniref:Uncharacterized protein n=2 Tax=Candidatus Yanofskyibacteriota TaxID=1752733 RepID=A0A1F8GJ54_9BACT|nr:MAG: hypothetical protein UW79_C0023G0014 [Candidatus Yanofskybacteria bacterium GW2011_GWA2_44_9]OGN04256.1 MAG: hypothetical protein A2659_03150 [Candidatus Yanofskybacteria bacterium RIFCSPHIGHO2_01_FULL_44_24]OGN14362.1 MAG: hypothetical protein A3B99_05095 [Candidatus Yanofskybacteria bacterium RIFCSPHIGHO2_02_FULL_44_12b]OGN25363.1 MAG: hypothetical protein A2925_00660 [Candidatus Yanofskybacteria bacterium RIFCSPLOWO2_01_FULL_44_22]